MCIVIDANAANHVKNGTVDGKPVRDWLLNPRIRAGLVVGGKLTEELVKAGLQDTLVELRRAARLCVVRDTDLQVATNEIDAAGGCRSNDAHVVALARASKCRLVFTGDIVLHTDLKNRALLPERVSIYQSSATHLGLLTECHCKPL